MSEASRKSAWSGDGGQTKLFSGETVTKDNARIEACGDLDELVCALGVARSHATVHRTVEAVLALQRTLFLVGSELATSPSSVDRLPRRLDSAAVEELEQTIFELNSALPKPAGFVVPGATKSSAFMDLARAVARRCERRVVGLQSRGELRNEYVMAWMNKLSICLWQLARLEESAASNES